MIIMDDRVLVNEIPTTRNNPTGLLGMGPLLIA